MPSHHHSLGRSAGAMASASARAACTLIALALTLAQGCADPCPGDAATVAAGRSCIATLNESILAAIEQDASEVRLPALGVDQWFLLAGGYQLTEEWLVAETRLRPSQRRLLLDMNHYDEKPTVAVIDDDCVIAVDDLRGVDWVAGSILRFDAGVSTLQITLVDGTGRREIGFGP